MIEFNLTSATVTIRFPPDVEFDAQEVADYADELSLGRCAILRVYRDRCLALQYVRQIDGRLARDS
ncbi:hypothetical protein HAP48_0035145 [Bradyrhizobium septentrionale]|uniref:Uncharacterized protein n=1 Tax=Bradyrhizobium septentrionale TaxID=1404411 RepID=A0A973VZT8_9BRAD|nr:hypothetical protein [Bradyrhizobium septentrionale]UGY13771.1 hypothetical protein HAP48_0035145 [Bradyrhizobium septentrionale]